MLRSALDTLRQPRYAALSALMAFVAIICVAAGTWQIARFEFKVTANDSLRDNARAASAPVGSVLPATTARGPAKDSVQLRTVTAAGRFDTAHQVLVANRTVRGKQGYLVLTPLRTTSGTSLLVVRGFAAAQADGSAPSTSTPPSGPVTVRGRVLVGETGSGTPSSARIARIVPKAWPSALGTPVYAGYVELLPSQPGTAGLTALPAPSLANPAGGAVEPQHFAYILQWYLFALLALAAPFAMARAERREQAMDEPDDSTELAEVRTPEQERAARLADRYGRPVRS
jgi:cytochrome oxidase assembly protein ShyY1